MTRDDRSARLAALARYNDRRAHFARLLGAGPLLDGPPWALRILGRAIDGERLDRVPVAR